jgi:imidazolonepropionase-like amidohydrolase
MRSRIVFALLFSLILACGSSDRPTETTEDERVMAEIATLTNTPAPIDAPTPRPPDTPTPLPVPTDTPEPEPANPVEETANLTESGKQPSNPVSASLVLVNGTLIDGTGSDPVSDAVVALEGERIVAVGTRAQLFIPPNTPTIDVQGATILPGFINAHVHQAYNRESLEVWAQSGVTTVRDLGNNGPPSDLFAFRDEVFQDPKYARLVAAGPMVTVPGVYGRQYVTSPEDARQTITTLLDDGADLIKISIEDDLQGRQWPMLSVEEIKAIVETAHARNMLVAAHISRSKHLELALERGVDDVAHMIVDDLPDDLIARMIKDNMYLEPTLELWQCVRSLHDLSWDTQAIDNLRRFSQAGGKVALGTDYAGYRCEFDLGMPMTEINLMRQADMTPRQIIVAATKNAAHVCNLEEEIGTLEPGKIADILVVEGNPLEDIQALTDVRMVIHNGVIIRN